MLAPHVMRAKGMIGTRADPGEEPRLIHAVVRSFLAHAARGTREPFIVEGQAFESELYPHDGSNVVPTGR